MLASVVHSEKFNQMKWVVDMLATLLLAILPIVVTLGLGFIAGWRQQFPANTSDSLIQLVMVYALPLSLFGGILTLKRAVIRENLAVAGWLAVGMLGGLLVLIVSQRLRRVPLTAATLRALSIASPSVPFMGTSVLLIVFGKISILLVALGGLYMNLIQVPASVFLLTLVGHETTTSPWVTLRRTLLTASKQPVVWAPILAFTLNLSGFKLPLQWLPLFTELGQAAGGVALFALGLILAAHQLKVTRPIVKNVGLKNLALPLVVWLAMHLLGLPLLTQQLVVITLAIPTAAIPTMLAVQQRLPADEYVATQLLSTLLAPITMGLLMLGLHVS